MKKYIFLITIFLLCCASQPYAADKPVSQLTEATAIAADDLLLLSYYNTGSYYSRKVKFSTLQSYVMALTEASALNLGTSQTHDGKIIFRSGTALNDYLFTIQASNFGANLTWTLPTAAPGGANYLLNVDADGTMGYTDPSTFNAGTATALAANPTDCASLGVATAIDASGNLTCGYSIGTHIQAYDADLAALAGLTSAANAIPYFTGSGTAGVISSSANMVSLLGSADYATARANLGLAIGTNVQAYNADLATLAAGGTAGCVWGEKSDSSGIECKTSINIQIDDSAAQFKSATASKGTLKFDQTGISDTKLVTVKYTAADSYAFTPTLLGNVSLSLGTTFTDGKYCTYSTANGFTCNADGGGGAGDLKADGSVPMTGALVPNAANTIALGSASAEWADIYLGDGAVIYGQNDQSNTITSSSTGWTFAKPISVADVSNDNFIKITNNTSRAATASVNELYPEGNVWKANQNGTESSIVIGPTNEQISFSGTLTNGKLCSYATGGAISCNSDASGSGDVTGAGDCTGGDCLDGSSDGGTYIRLYDGTSAYTALTAAVRKFTISSSVADSEDLAITLGNNDNKVTVSSSTGVTEANFSALNLVTTGTVSGKIPMISKSGNYTLGTDNAQEAYGYMVWLTGDGTILTLPAVAAGMSVCVYSADSYDKVVNPNDNDGIRNGTTTRNADGHAITSGATDQGSFVCLVGDSADGWTVLGKAGTWTDE